MYDELVKRLRHDSESRALMVDAADAIEELDGFLCEAERDRDEYRERLDKTNDILLNRWIPVTERLPEEKQDGFSEDVLVFVENPDGDITWRDIYVGYYLHDSTDSETGWWTMMTCGCAKIGEHKHGGKVFPANEYVTHWRPLPPMPEPPKEEAPAGPYDLLYEEGGYNSNGV